MFKEWNKTFDKLRHKHDTWYIFRDLNRIVLNLQEMSEIVEREGE